MQQNILSALALALVHSLWQGLLIGLLAALVLPKMRSALARYRFSFLALLGLFGAFLATFWHFLSAKAAIEEVKGPVFQLNLSGQIERVFGPETAAVAPSFFEKTTAWLEANQAFIVGLWLIGFAFFFLKLVGGWLLAEQFKTRKTARLADEWEEIFRELLQKMPIEKPVRLLESALISAPVTLGWLRPVVLFPIGLVNRLSIDEIEAVMAHELAHIARRDWLANIAQSVIESLFYYHPVAWRLGSRLREERENCADDLALAVTRGEPLGYAKTLVAVQELAFLQQKTCPELASAGPKPALALAFSDKNSGSLAARIQRILIQQQPIKNLAMEKIAATGLLLGLAVALSLRANPAKPMIENLAALATDPVEFFEETAAVADSLPPKAKLRGTGDLSFSNEKESIKLRLENDKIQSLEINGEVISAEKFDDFEPKISEMIARIARPLEPMAPMAPMSPMTAMAPTSPMSPMAPMAPIAPFSFHFDFPGSDGPLVDGLRGVSSAFGNGAAISGNGSGIAVFGTVNHFESDRNDEVYVITDGRKKLKIDGETGQIFLNGKALEPGKNVEIFTKNQGTDAFFTVKGQSFRIRKGQLEWRSAANEAEFLAAEKEAQKAQRMADSEARQFDFEARQQSILDARRADSEAREHLFKQLEHEQEARRDALLAEREIREAEREARENERDALRESARAQRDAARTERAAAREHRNSSISRSGAASYSYGDSEQAEKAQKTQSAFDAELKKDGFDSDNISIKMNSKSLKINGKTQPDAVFEKYKALWEHESGDRVGDDFNMTITRSSN